MKPRIVQIVGPTACGKTALTVPLVKALHAELINVDSMQVYKDLEIGTDKPDASMREEIPIFGIDLIDIGPPMDAASFAALVRERIDSLHKQGILPVLSGGTGLYHKAIRYGMLEAPSRDDAFRAELRARRDREGITIIYAELQAKDPETASKIHANDWLRIERALEFMALTGQKFSASREAHAFNDSPYEVLGIALSRPREELYRRIDRRLEEMWRSGLLEETRLLLEHSLDPEQLPLKALGYKSAAAYLLGQMSEDEALANAKRDTRRFAKRQLTWFRADKSLTWIKMPLDDKEFDTLIEMVRRFRESGIVNFDGLRIDNDNNP